MKSIIKIVAIVIVSTLALSAQNQNKNAVTTFKVKGMCEMCKARIEAAAYVKGVKMVTWDKHTGDIKVYYNPEKTDPLLVQKSIAEAGHDTEAVQASIEAYQNLPACCQYKSGTIHKH